MLNPNASHFTAHKCIDCSRGSLHTRARARVRVRTARCICTRAYLLSDPLLRCPPNIYLVEYTLYSVIYSFLNTSFDFSMSSHMEKVSGEPGSVFMCYKKIYVYKDNRNVTSLEMEMHQEDLYGKPW